MHISYILISLSLTLGVKSQNSHLCCPIESIQLPPQHDCWRIFKSNTFVVVPNPEQSKHYQRDIPRTCEASRADIDKSIGESQRDIASLADPDYCSNKLLTLICLFYFPVCQGRDDDDAAAAVKLMRPPVFPCRSVCEEVTAPDSNCSQIIDSKNSTWGPFYAGCNYTFYSSGDILNVNSGSRPVYRDRGNFCFDETHVFKNDPVTSSAPIIATTSKPCANEESAVLPKDIDPTHRCRNKKSVIFDDVSDKTVGKSKATYSLNCTVVSVIKDGNGIYNKNAIKCRVNEFRKLKEEGACDNALSAGTEVFVLGYSTNCLHKTSSIGQTFDDNSIGQYYQIFGKYCIEYCDQTLLYLTHRDIAARQVNSL